MPLAILRPASWEWLLFLHLVAALLLFSGALVVTVTALAAARRMAGDGALLQRVGYWTLIAAVWPGLLGTIAAGEGLAARESARGDWLDAGRALTFATGILGSAALTWLARRSRLRLALRGEAEGGLGTRSASLVAPALLSVLVAVAYLMTAKPGS